MALGLGLVLTLGSTLVASDWPQLRGQNRDGVSGEANLADSWPEAGLPLLFKAAIGRGFSEVSASEGRLYTQYSEGESEEASEFAGCFDALTGKKIWAVRLGREFVDEFGNGPRSTPTLDGDLGYFLGSYGHLMALSRSDGSVKWAVELSEAFGSKTPRWGFSTSPLIDGDQLVLELGGGEGKGFGAFEKRTGKLLWKSQDAPPSYCSPLMIEPFGVKQYVFVVGSKVISITPGGKELWSFPWQENTMTIAVPVFLPPDRIFVSASGDGGAMVIKLSQVAGLLDVQTVWKNRSIKNHFSSSVIHEGFLYGFDNATLRCIDLSSGKRIWAKRGFGKGALILADDKLYILSDQGRLALAKASKDGYIELSSFDGLEGKCWTAPTLSEGRLYLRNHEALVAYDLGTGE